MVENCKVNVTLIHKCGVFWPEISGVARNLRWRGFYPKNFIYHVKFLDDLLKVISIG